MSRAGEGRADIIFGAARIRPSTEQLDRAIAQCAEAWIKETGKEYGQQDLSVWDRLCNAVWRKQEEMAALRAVGEGEG
jgi:hypothetical protein